MSYEAALVLFNKRSEIMDARDMEEARLKALIEKNREDSAKRIDPLTKAMKEVCDHTGQYLKFVDDTSWDYHNNVECGSYFARCPLCGTCKNISEYDFKNKVNPFN